MKKITLACLLATVLASPAFAQGKEPTPAEIEKKRQAEELDRRYKSTMQRTNTDAVQTRTDPWANMRGSTETPPKR